MGTKFFYIAKIRPNGPEKVNDRPFQRLQGGTNFENLSKNARKRQRIISTAQAASLQCL